MAFSDPCWRFPEYYGSCGRLSIFSHGGSSLSRFLSSSWLKRASLALQLLELAFLFSKNSLGIAIYPTDWTAENFSVDSEGVVRLIDLENILVVNQTGLQERGE